MEETAKVLPAMAAKGGLREAKPTNCMKCNKVLKKKIWYYRNGRYYCSKTCWRSFVKAEKPPAGPA